MYLGIDYGKKRIGLALGTLIPQGIGVIDAELTPETIYSKIKSICLENDVQGIVIGIPIRSQGEDGALVGEIRAFAAALSEMTGLPVHFEEEQFTSAEAERLLGRVNEKDRKAGKVDELAAVLILEQFLHTIETQKDTEESNKR